MKSLSATHKPYLKWAGGKTQLLAQFAALYPREFAGYHEPFVGSAAVYLHLLDLQARGDIHTDWARVRLTDSNAELINCHHIVAHDLDTLIRRLAYHKRKHSHDYYYAVRAQNPDKLDAVHRAARLIYLNKTCFNGLYRVNRRGLFNVPIGSYKEPRIFDRADLAWASQALQCAEIALADFREVLSHARRGDFVYFDPPYHPVSKTASFTAYTGAAFGDAEQRALAQVFCDLDRKGCRVMLSNSWTPFVLELYHAFNVIEVKANRAINSQADKRGKISEVVVLNYANRTRFG